MHPRNLSQSSSLRLRRCSRTRRGSEEGEKTRGDSLRFHTPETTRSCGREGRGQEPSWAVHLALQILTREWQAIPDFRRREQKTREEREPCRAPASLEDRSQALCSPQAKRLGHPDPRQSLEAKTQTKSDRPGMSATGANCLLAHSKRLRVSFACRPSPRGRRKKRKQTPARRKKARPGTGLPKGSWADQTKQRRETEKSSQRTGRPADRPAVRPARSTGFCGEYR